MTRDKKYVERAATLKLLGDGRVTYRDENGNELPENFVRKAKEQNRDSILDWLEGEAVEINQKIKPLLSVHLATPPPDTEIAFHPKRFKTPKPAPPDRSQFFPPRPTPPEMHEHSRLERSVAFLRKRADAKQQRLMREYEQNLAGWQKEEPRYQEEFDAVSSDYRDRLDQWQKQKADFEAEQERERRLIQEERHRDPDAMNVFLAQRLVECEWSEGIEVIPRVKVAGRTPYIDVQVPASDAVEIPKHTASVNRRSLRLTLKENSQTYIRKCYLAHIHAVGFRLIGEAFVALPTTPVVVLSAFVKQPSKRTGQLMDEYLYCVRVPRSSWEEINFQRLEAIDVVEGLRNSKSAAMSLGGE